MEPNTPNIGNILTAIGLSLLIVVGFHYLYEKPLAEAQKKQAIVALAQQQAQQQSQTQPNSKTANNAYLKIAQPSPTRGRDTIIAETRNERLNVSSPSLRGSINLRGGRIDDITLTRYRETVAPDSPPIVLMSPQGSAAPNLPWYAEFGWLTDVDTPMPSSNTLWKADVSELTPDKPAVLTWDNGKGLRFERRISVDENFMFTITDRVRNASGQQLTLWPFGLVARHGKPHTQDIYILHEGPIGVLGGTLKDPKYKDIIKEKQISYTTTGGWLGFTDKYWLVSLLHDNKATLNANFTFDQGSAAKPEDGTFQADARGSAIRLQSGEVAENTTRLFAGAKLLRLIDNYERTLNVPLFDRAIDFGWYYFLTKPLLYLLDWLGTSLGNFGLAILALTLLLRGATFPLSVKSYRSMARMKALQPEVKRLQELYAEDRVRLGSEMMELYRREKVNPASGCLPNLLQIPVFFALYKVLYVGIELRHAPLFGWIKDLSAPDPTSVLTLFGYIDISFIPHLGIWPLLMGISMFLQQRLSPQPTDKTQAQVFMWMPIIFTFMLANVAVGLIVYWTLSNLLGIAQQAYIMRTTKKG